MMWTLIGSESEKPAVLTEILITRGGLMDKICDIMCSTEANPSVILSTDT